MEQKIGRFCCTSDFIFPNFVGIRLVYHVNLLGQIWNLEKHSPLITGERWVHAQFAS